MSHWLRSLAAITLAALFVLPTAAPALEKTAARFTGEDRDDWSRATTTCRVVYYNTCQGWVWIWSGWSPGDRLGVWFQDCCPGGFDVHEVLDTFLFVWTPSPSGYGFTGTMDVWATDAQGCLTGSPLRSVPFLPFGPGANGSGWASVDWSSNPIDVSGADFAVTYTLTQTTADPMAIASDHPAAGPTGPAACGTCYPTTRQARSFYYGTDVAPLCNDPQNMNLSDPTNCPAAFLWDVDMQCSMSTPVESSSWGQIKGLYR